MQAFDPVRRAFCLLALLPALVSAQEARLPEVLLDEWSVIRLGDSDLGHVHSKTTRNAQGDIETHMDLHLAMKRLGTTIGIEQTALTVERPDGSLVRIEQKGSVSNQTTETEVTFADGEARIVTRLMGRTREQMIPCPPDAVGPYRLHRLGLEHGFQPGTSWETTTFSADLMTSTAVYVSVVGPEEVELLDGRKATLTRVKTELDEVPIPTTTWVDADGNALLTKVTVAGMQLETYMVSEERARGSSGGGELSPDVFANSMIVADALLPHPRRLDAVVLDMRVTRAAAAGVELPRTPWQQVGERGAAGVQRVVVKRIVPPEDRDAVRPLRETPPELADALAANTMIQSDEPEIVEIATRVVGDEKDAWRAAQRLEAWVQENITEKSMGVGFASALEVCRERRGDCSEHAVLLAALCRAAGVPARVAMGVLYVGGIWGGHAWDEVWIDGAWYPLDGTLGYGSADPLRLMMSTQTLRDGQLAKQFAGLMGLLGNIEIDVVEIVYEGERIPVAGAPAATTDGGRYTNRLWGFSCGKPEGWAFEPQQPGRGIAFRLLEIESADDAAPRREIRVDAHDMPADFDWDELLERHAEAATTREITVDGRPGRLFRHKSALGALVAAGPALFVFSLHPGEGEDAGKLLEDFLRSVDFDAPRS